MPRPAAYLPPFLPVFLPPPSPNPSLIALLFYTAAACCFDYVCPFIYCPALFLFVELKFLYVHMERINDGCVDSLNVIFVPPCFLDLFSFNLVVQQVDLFPARRLRYSITRPKWIQQNYRLFGM